MALGIVEQQIRLPAEPPNEMPGGMPMVPEVLVPRIGDYMIERGLLSTHSLEKALDYQQQRAKDGKPLLLGQALLELGLTNRETLDQVVTTQILELQNALSESNRTLKQRVQARTQELQQALERLSELSILKSNFIANISHELRTPLTHLKGYIDLLTEGGMGQLSSTQLDALKIMQRSEARLERLIDDIIQFAMSTRGELSLNMQNFDLARLINVIVERGITKAQAAEITISLKMPPSLPSVRGDEDKIAWVISQLLDNGMKFTPKGGRVVVQVKEEANLVNVSVSDTGIGIPSDRMHEIFEPFHQLDGSPTRRYSGTGLGLALVRRIIEAHGSQMRVHSVVGKGSWFEFTLPASVVSRSVENPSQVTHE
jgi:signal transduction histidine kinase